MISEVGGESFTTLKESFMCASIITRVTHRAGASISVDIYGGFAVTNKC